MSAVTGNRAIGNPDPPDSPSREPVLSGPFPTKQKAREPVWDALVEHHVARFPFPPHGRIPNFAGADAAARRLLALPEFGGARHIKVNPDAAQRYVRAGALRRGITVYVPTPRLRGGFRRLDPRRIPEGCFDEAAVLSKLERWSTPVGVSDLPRLDLVVVGAVAVTRDGRRCGKGQGYSDIEYAILRSLGHPPLPVFTTVHELQIVSAFPVGRHDPPVSVIVTADRVLRVPSPPPSPVGIDWDELPAEALAAMPALRELQALCDGKS